jgi:hypothetical protein
MTGGFFSWSHDLEFIDPSVERGIGGCSDDAAHCLGFLLLGLRLEDVEDVAFVQRRQHRCEGPRRQEELPCLACGQLPQPLAGIADRNESFADPAIDVVRDSHPFRGDEVDLPASDLPFHSRRGFPD